MAVLSLDVDEYTVSIYGIDAAAERLINEAKHRGDPLVGTYSVRKDPPRSAKGQYHLHVYLKRNQLFAINRDGTAHDDSHGVAIPSKVATALRDAFPTFIIPNSNLIEGCDPKLLTTLLLEGVAAQRTRPSV